MITTFITPSGRYRIYQAKKRIREILKARWKVENASLCIQRNWYQWKMQFHTFFLMSAYRAREICDGIEKQDRNRLRNILSLGRVKNLFRKQLIIVRNSAARLVNTPSNTPLTPLLTRTLTYNTALSHLLTHHHCCA